MSPLAVALAPDVEAQVNRVLDGALQCAALRAASFGPQYGLLWSELARSAHGGKRFRSAIVIGVHAGLGDPHPRAAVSVAAGFELLHTAFLIHDDLIDGDTMRRGRPNLAATMRADALARGHDPQRADRWATAAAVLAGDLALGQAHRLVATEQAPASARAALMNLLDETLLVTVGGELADTAFGLGLHDPTLEESLRVAESKTAMYSFRAPLQAGAILAGASDALLAELDDQGRLLGRAFQLVDDLLGVFAPQAVTGKSDISDLREGKRTPLLLHARSLPVWDELAGDIGRPDLDEPTADRLRGALARSAAPGMVQESVRAELDEVDRRLAAGALPVGLEPVVGAVTATIRRALADVGHRIEEVRCQAV
ncbi:MAG TPA: polyprenyl synthetase family protein [Actinotalea sp.]|nr:polyprenyl synthetase family protein [Actinotalea sp.]